MLISLMSIAFNYNNIKDQTVKCLQAWLMLKKRLDMHREVYNFVSWFQMQNLGMQLCSLLQGELWISHDFFLLESSFLVLFL